MLAGNPHESKARIDALQTLRALAAVVGHSELERRVGRNSRRAREMAHRKRHVLAVLCYVMLKRRMPHKS